ncbi:unnamed protein product [Arabidopsis arenosa]|uniref:Uncharacterized protein n=1 Tax=Arabidopsis arenosa TaxID=38785 RepID=A0A8S2AM45_ARAAE|nr:unnamed protein product [Arabidopsis arenosa]
MAKKGEHSGAKEVKLAKPKISMSDLTFVIYVTTEEKMLALKKLGAELDFGSNDRFYIQVENLSHLGMSKSSMAGVNIKCEVIYKDDWEEEDDDVIIVDARRPLDTNFGWLNNDLVTPKGYILNRGLVADITVSFKSGLFDKIDLQIFHQGEGRYFSLDDTLSYLQCFFLPKI